MYLLNIITRCKKPADLLQIKNSIFTEEDRPIKWHVIFDTSILKEIDASIIQEISAVAKIHFYKDGSSYLAVNRVIETIEDGFVYLLSGDSELHPELYTKFIEKIGEDKKIFVFAQSFNNGESIRNPFLQNIRPGHIDGSQYILHKSIYHYHQFVDAFNADGILIQEVVNAHQEELIVSTDILSVHESLKPRKKARLPRVLFIGKDEPVLTTNNPYYWESSELDVKYVKTSHKLEEILIDWDPDVIVTNSDNPDTLANLNGAPLEVRAKWINLTEINDDAGEIAYLVAMRNILYRRRTHLISFFTPAYNTGPDLLKTYQSLANQTYNNWEWIIVNDSTDEGLTLKIAEDIAKKDGRVKVYDFREKSGGLIGEVKWRACSMTTGELLVELDHDDMVTPDCAEILHDAALKFPEAGFFYSDAPEVDLNWNSNQYGEGFGLGYGSYREDTIFGSVKVQSAVTPGVNPKTIRHIVGVPNHVRAWRRSAYFAAGGHNRELTIADDYELIVRTFLTTKMVHIPKTLYVQFLYNNGVDMNTQDLTRADIQRRVKTIAQFYNLQIKERFERLGYVDWAYQENQEDPTQAISRYGEREGKVNLTYIID